MDELIGRRVAKVGVKRTAAPSAADAATQRQGETVPARAPRAFIQDDFLAGGAISAGGCMFARETAGKSAVGDIAGAIPVCGQ